MTSYTGSTKTLFEIQNSKAAYERMLSAFDDKQIVDEEFLKEIQMILTNGTYDERRYQIGERPGEYKHHDYVTGKNEVGAPVDDVHEEICELLDELEDIDDENALVAAVYFHAKFENIHPFSEGNGRLQRLFIEYLANNAGYSVDFSNVLAKEMIISSAESFACEYDKINEMFDRITTKL